MLVAAPFDVMPRAYADIIRDARRYYARDAQIAAAPHRSIYHTRYVSLMPPCSIRQNNTVMAATFAVVTRRYAYATFRHADYFAFFHAMIRLITLFLLHDTMPAAAATLFDAMLPLRRAAQWEKRGGSAALFFITLRLRHYAITLIYAAALTHSCHAMPR